jgi:hypothetical protein
MDEFFEIRYLADSMINYLHTVSLYSIILSCWVEKVEEGAEHSTDSLDHKMVQKMLHSASLIFSHSGPSHFRAQTDHVSRSCFPFSQISSGRRLT